MKKMMFALACASSLALFADVAAPKADFEGYGANVDKIGGYDESGDTSGDLFWIFMGASGTTDGSSVKTYGGDNLAKPAKVDVGDNYLELSTEGGTLWRSLNPADNGTVLGEGQDLTESDLYVDTMVQFTPTEDGGMPETAQGDKLAIWLDVDTEGNTNLCVKAAVVDDQYTITPTKFILTNAGDVQAGTWYHLKVRAIADITGREEIPGFEITLNDTVMVADKMTLTEEFAEMLDDDAINAKTVFASLAGIDGEPTLTAVGFKGSGAIDNLSITAEDPSPEGAEVPVSVSVVNATVEGIESDKAKAGDTLTFAVKPAEGYQIDSVTVNGEEVEADADDNYNYTVQEEDEAVEIVITTSEAKPAYPEYIGNDEAKQAKYDKWAKANNIAAADFSDAAKANQKAYLLNVAPGKAAEDAEKAFKIKAIEVAADGTVTVTPPEGNFNGTVEVKGCATIDGEYTLPVTDGTAKFFKAFLK